MENLLRESFSHHIEGRQLACSQPYLNSVDLLVVTPPNLLLIIFSVILLSRKQGKTSDESDGEKKEGISDLDAF